MTQPTISAERIEEMLAGLEGPVGAAVIRGDDLADVRTAMTLALSALRAQAQGSEAVADDRLEDAARSVVSMIDEWYAGWRKQHIPAKAVATRLRRFLPASPLVQAQARTEAELEALPAHPLASWRGGLALGLHRVFWKSGGSSLCAIGMQSDGRRWIAPCNWLAPALDAEGSSWAEIERTEVIAPYPDATPPAPVGGPTHRHVKRGTEYGLIGIGKMQTQDWYEQGHDVMNRLVYETADMAEVAIYRSVNDGSLWARPREEFEDGRFEALTASRAAVAQDETP